MKTQVPRSVTEVYVDFIRSPDAANLSGCITYGNLNKLIVAKYPFLEPVWQYVVSCRVWVNLKNLPDTDSAYVAERRWLEERIHLTSWIEGPNGGGTWTTRTPRNQLKQVPARATEIYTAIVLNNELCGSLKGLTFTELKDRIASFFPENELSVANLVSIRLWQKLKVFPSRDAAYCAQFKAETQVYGLQAWFTQPEPSASMPDKEKDKDVRIDLRNIDYADLETRMMAEPQVYQNQFLSELSDGHLDKNRVFTAALVERFKTERPNHKLKGLLISTPTGQDSWPRFEPDSKEVLFPQPPKKVITMNVNKPYENISYVYGVEAAKASDAHLIDSIKRVDTEINGLADLKGTSKKVDAMVKSLEGDKAAIVAILDSRP